MKTIKEIEKGCKEVWFGDELKYCCGFGKLCSNCEALLQQSQDIIEIIESMPVVKRLKDGSQVPFREENAIILTAFKHEIKSSIIGSEEKT